jgi:hypothetical protein
VNFQPIKLNKNKGQLKQVTDELSVDTESRIKEGRMTRQSNESKALALEHMVHKLDLLASDHPFENY